MDIITGEKIQALCNHHISIVEFQPYELQGVSYIDPYKFNSPVFNNKPLVYVNIDLVRGPIPSSNLSEESKKTQVFKKEIDLHKILSTFLNPFSLILHNNDYNFKEKDLNLLSIPNCQKIYTQNCTVTHPNVVPLPIGIANSCWPWGDLNVWNKVKVIEKKENFIYFNFTIEGGCRDVKRPSCFNRISKLGIPWQDTKDYETYLKDLSTYKFCISPEGNGIDCHRTWEALYLKVIPIVDRNSTTEFFSKIFPMVLVDNWDTFEIGSLDLVYADTTWENYDLLFFTNFIGRFLKNE